MNISMNIGEVLTKAWKITWKYKVLWIFGILAGCGASNRNGFNSNFNSGNSGRNPDSFNSGDLPEPFKQFEKMNWQEAIGTFLNQYWVMIVVIVSLLCLLSFLFYFLGVIGKTGLIKGTSKADKDAEKLGFAELWTESLPYFWRMFGLSLLVSLPAFIVLMLVLVLLFVGLFSLIGSSQSSADGMGPLVAILGISIPAICCLGILSIPISMIVEQAKNAIIIQDIGVIESLRQGWDVFKRNFLTLIIISIILGVISAVVSFIVSLPLIIAVVPAVIGIFMMATKSADTATAIAPLAIAGICILAYSPILLILRGVEQAYAQSALTLTYIRLTTPVPVPAPELPAETIDAQ